jgi:ribosomal protein L11 methyltransferase
MNWLEVSLTVDGEMAEAVAEVLARHVAGVVIESTAIEANVEDEGRPVGPLRVCAYLPMDAQLEETRQRIEESLWYLGRIRKLPTPQFKPVEAVDWAETWKQHYKPIPIGKRLIIVPAWLTPPVDEGSQRIPIFIDVGMAFGTGTHPTTQLCLEMLDDYTPQGGDVFDIGCGSGILSVAALKLGAARAFGVDVEDVAVPAADQNAANNAVTKQVQFAVGSVDEIKAGFFEIDQAPLVLANILAPILMRLLAAGMGDVIAPGGVLILSGILAEQIPQMKETIESHGLQIAEQRQIDDWVAIAVKK